jgi:hypothetical protein
VWAIEARAAVRLTDEQLRRLQERLAGCAAEVCVEEETVRLGFRVQGESLAEAVAEAMSRLGGHLPIVRLSVMTLEELERERPQLPDLVGIVDIQELAGLGSRQRALQVTRLPAFPDPALKTRAGRLWARAAVDDFLRRWPRRPGRPRKGGGSETTIIREEKES